MMKLGLALILSLNSTMAHSMGPHTASYYGTVEKFQNQYTLKLLNNASATVHFESVSTTTDSGEVLVGLVPKLSRSIPLNLDAQSIAKIEKGPQGRIFMITSEDWSGTNLKFSRVLPADTFIECENNDPEIVQLRKSEKTSIWLSSDIFELAKKCATKKFYGEE